MKIALCYNSPNFYMEEISSLILGTYDHSNIYLLAWGGGFLEDA